MNGYQCRLQPTTFGKSKDMLPCFVDLSSNNLPKNTHQHLLETQGWKFPTWAIPWNCQLPSTYHVHASYSLYMLYTYMYIHMHINILYINMPIPAQYIDVHLNYSKSPGELGLCRNPTFRVHHLISSNFTRPRMLKKGQCFDPIFHFTRLVWKSLGDFPTPEV